MAEVDERVEKLRRVISTIRWDISVMENDDLRSRKQVYLQELQDELKSLLG